MLNKNFKRCAIAGLIVSVIVLALPSARSQGGAANFSFRSVSGEAVTSESVRGEVVVLAFGASWLPLTRNQMEAVKKLADQYAGRGVAVYWVSTESDSAKSKNYVSDDQLRELGRKYKVTVLRDPDGVASKRMGVDQLPSVVIIDKQGNTAATIGGFDPQADLGKQLAARLDKIL